ncbi:unnamed protein product [Vitrella brassicaformis CCMP3155]|uniref:Uncharacterized protein n=1 Tax=Vitrella brassicaformis (strain CCMP3155) TaxID=1169540 RepID=A0A0G4EM48_VITBC|nr:unnamed protein product [Vitrella brassicaformis CCMP3155]|eukprot:CEL98520.1 unnamed protein product [Vitrella brassicaformis CCMP3155]
MAVSLAKALRVLCCCEDALPHAEVVVQGGHLPQAAITGEALHEQLGPGEVARPGSRGFFKEEDAGIVRPPSSYVPPHHHDHPQYPYYNNTSSTTASPHHSSPSLYASGSSFPTNTPLLTHTQPLPPQHQNPNHLQHNSNSSMPSSPHHPIPAFANDSSAAALSPTTASSRSPEPHHGMGAGVGTVSNNASPSMTPEERIAERDRLQRLVKEFAKKAIKGVHCTLVDPYTGDMVPHELKLDRSITMLSLEALNSVPNTTDGGPAIRRSGVRRDRRLLEIDTIYRGTEVARKVSEPLRATATFCVGLDMKGGADGVVGDNGGGDGVDRVIFHLGDGRAREEFYTTMKILRMFAELNAKRQAEKGQQQQQQDKQGEASGSSSSAASIAAVRGNTR